MGMQVLLVMVVLGGVSTIHPLNVGSPPLPREATAPHVSVDAGAGVLRLAQKSLIAAKRIRGRLLGGAGATVTLYDPHGVLLDATRADTDGNFTIDLGALDNDELKALGKCYIEVGGKQGGPHRVDLKRIAVSDTGVIILPDLTVR